MAPHTHVSARLSAAAATTALALLAAAAAQAQQTPPPPDPGLLERGRYLVEIAAACGLCHTTPGPGGASRPGMEQAGGRVFEERGFRAVAPNITPDPETGIGRWTDAEVAAAIREGRRPDGSLLGPPMQVEAYRGLSDRDLAATVAYLRAIPPVRHAVTERSRYPFELQPIGPPVASVPDPPEDDPVARGAYLAVNVAHCMNCHSPPLAEGRRDPARAGGTGLVIEGPWGAVVARNISSHPEHGIGRWTDEEVMRALTEGVAPGGRRLAPPMAARAPYLARLSERDRRDLHAFIRSLPPQER